MTRVFRKHNLLLLSGLLSIIVGLVIFILVINNYQKNAKFIAGAAQTQGIVYNVRSLKNNKYSFEYKYNVNNKEYKKYVSSMKFENKLKENDSIVVYYSKEKANLNIIKKSSKTEICIAVIFLIIFTAIGMLNIIKFLKK